MFNKRRRSLFKKANELSVKTNTELHIVMHRGGRYFTYNSTDRQGWPPTEDDMVRSLVATLPVEQRLKSAIDLTTAD